MKKVLVTVLTLGLMLGIFTGNVDVAHAEENQTYSVQGDPTTGG
jgi:hypothetical protein